MKSTRGRLVHVASLEAFDRRTAAGARSLSGWRLRGLDLRERSEVLARLPARRGDVPRLHLRRGRRRTGRGRRRAGAAGDPGRPGRPVPRPPLLAPRALRHPGLPGVRSTRAPTPGPSSPTTHDALLAQALHDHAVDVALEEALAGWRRTRRVVGVMGGTRSQRGDAAYADAARLGRGARRPPPGGHRWRAGRHGGGQPRRLAVRPRRRRARRGAGGAGPGAVVPALDRGVGGRRVRRPRPLPRRRGVAGHPDLALRPRAAQRLRHGDREVLPQRHPRGDPARGLRRRHRVPARRRRHRAGGLPGRLRELLRRRVRGGADGAGRSRATGPRRVPAWPLLHALARGRTMEQQVHLVDTVDEAAQLARGTTRPRRAGRRRRRSRCPGCRAPWSGCPWPPAGARTRARRPGRRRSTSSRASGSAGSG